MIGSCFSLSLIQTSFNNNLQILCVISMEVAFSNLEAFRRAKKQIRRKMESTDYTRAKERIGGAQNVRIIKKKPVYVAAASGEIKGNIKVTTN